MHATVRLALVAVIAGLAFSAVSAEQTYSVSPGIGDGDPLAGARNTVRAARRNGTLKAGTPVTVYLEPGDYRLRSTFELSGEDSGSPGAPVVYRARKAGSVRILGGIGLEPGDFKPVSDPAVLARLVPAVRSHILVCDVAPLVSEEFAPWKPSFRGAPPAPWLYFKGSPMTLARWPNAAAPGGGWAEFSKAEDTGLPKPDAADLALRAAHPGAFVFDDPRPARWKIDEGAWLLGYWTHDWSDEVLRIGSYDREKQRIQLAAPHVYGIAAGTWGAAKRRFFAMNLLEELDAPGEWYLDRPKKQLYFFPPGPMEKGQAILGLMSQPLVRINGGSYIQLVDLAFECSHGDGLLVQNGQGNLVAGCRIDNLAGTGISIDGQQNEIRSCDLFNLGKGGINLNGGDRKALTPAKNLAFNNHIHHYGLFQRTYAAGINAQGCGQIARNNFIHDAPHNAVLYGGNENLFEYNEVCRVVMETGDAGAFYTGRDWTSQGNVLRHNYIHDLGGGDAGHVNTMGVYLDDCDSGDVLEGNVFYRAGRAIMVGGGRDNTISGNLVVDCPIGLHLDSRGMTWKQWNDPADPSWHLEAKAQKLNYTQPPWSDRYPKLARIMQEHPKEPLGNVIVGNVLVDCTRQWCDFDGDVRKLQAKLKIEENLAINSRAANNVVAARDLKGFRIVSGSPTAPVSLGFDHGSAAEFKWSSNANAALVKLLPAFKPVPMDRIGLVTDEYRKEVPAK